MSDETRTQSQAADAPPAPVPSSGLPGVDGRSPMNFLGQVQAQLDALRSMVGEHAQRQADLAAREAALDQRGQSLAAAEASLAAREASLAASDDAMRERAAALQSREDAATELARQLDERARLAAEAEAAQVARAQEQARREGELEAVRKELEGKVASAESAGRAAGEEAAAARAQLARASEEARESRMLIERLDAEVGELRAALAAAQAESRRAGESGAVAEEARAELERAQSQTRALEAELAEARRLLDERASAPPVTAAPDPEMLRAVEEARADAQAAASRVEDLLRAVEARDESLRRAASQVAELQAAMDAAAADRSPPSPSVPEASEGLSEQAARVLLRQERLVRYKQLLHQQSGKIVKAKAALQKRTAECEQILSQRGKIAEAMEGVAQQKRVLAARAARTGAAAIAAYSMVSIAMVAGLAWGVARQAAPAVYAARAELAAESSSRELSAEELKAWSAAHVALAKDPQVIGTAAEQFARRGMNDLGTIAAVKARVADTLYAQSDKPGALVIEHRAAGSERAARELETYLSAYLSVCNAQREARGDGAATVITGTPAAGQEPIDSARMTYAASIAGGGLMLALAIGVAGYRVLSRAKDRVERDLADVAL